MVAKEQRDATAPGARVLFVDDDAEFGELAKLGLTCAGFRVMVSSSAAEALEMLDQRPFELAIIDLGLPQDDALRLIALIRGATRFAHLAIVVVSGPQDGKVFLEALAIGADSIAMKPIDWNQLADLVVSAIAEKSTRDDECGSSGPR